MILLFFLIGLVFAQPVFASHIPAPQGYVNDFANALTVEQKSNLENKLQNYQQQTTNEITIATVKSLNGQDIEDFTVKTFEEWKIGKKGKDNGILLLSAIEDRKVRIEVGYGLEQYVTDGRAGQIIREVIAPNFRENKYYEGLDQSVSQIVNLISSENKDTSISDKKGFSLEAIWILLVIFIYVGAYLGRSKEFWQGGVAGGIFGLLIGLLIGTLAIIALSIVILAALGLLLDFVLSKNYQQRKQLGKPTGFWGSWGGFSSGSSSFGGFGGGGSGGGGSSGGW